MVLLKYLNELSFYYFAAQTEELAQVTYNSMYLCIGHMYRYGIVVLALITILRSGEEESYPPTPTRFYISPAGVHSLVLILTTVTHRVLRGCLADCTCHTFTPRRLLHNTHIIQRSISLHIRRGKVKLRVTLPIEHTCCVILCRSDYVF